MKKLLSIILALVMCLSLTVTAFAADTPISARERSPLWDVKMRNNHGAFLGEMSLSISLSDIVALGMGQNFHESTWEQAVGNATVTLQNGVTLNKNCGATPNYIARVTEENNNRQYVAEYTIMDGFFDGTDYYSVYISGTIAQKGTKATANMQFGDTKIDISGVVYDQKEVHVYGSQTHTAEDSTQTYNIDIRKLTPTRTAATFTDVSSTKWYHEPVQMAYRTGLIEGASVDARGYVSFLPDNNLTLSQALTLAVRLHADIEGNTIRQVSAGEEWYAPYLEYAQTHKILPNSLKNTAMNKYVTRGEFAAITATLFDRGVTPHIIMPDNSGAENAFYLSRPSDVDVGGSKYHPYAKEIFILYDNGIVAGNDSKGTYSPDSYLTRAEAATVLLRVRHYGERMTSGNNMVLHTRQLSPAPALSVFNTGASD